jgi:hypothetical protein
VEARLDNITRDGIRDYVAKHGRRGQMIVDGISKILPTIQIIFDTDVGKEILKEDIEKCELLLEKLIDLDATDEDKVEFRYLRDRIIRLGKKLEMFFNYIKDIQS